MPDTKKPSTGEILKRLNRGMTTTVEPRNARKSAQGSEVVISKVAIEDYRRCFLDKKMRHPPNPKGTRPPAAADAAITFPRADVALLPELETGRPQML